MTWRPYIIWGWVIILTLMTHVHWCSQCQNMTLIYHQWRGGNDESSFSGGGGPTSWRPFIIWGWVIILTLMTHVHWCSQCQNMTLICQQWRGENDESSFSGGRGTRVMTPIHHLRISHHPDDTKFKICCQYSKTLNNILNQPLKCVHTEGIKQFYTNTLVYCIR